MEIFINYNFALDRAGKILVYIGFYCLGLRIDYACKYRHFLLKVGGTFYNFPEHKLNILNVV